MAMLHVLHPHSLAVCQFGSFEISFGINQYMLILAFILGIALPCEPTGCYTEILSPTKGKFKFYTTCFLSVCALKCQNGKTIAV